MISEYQHTQKGTLITRCLLAASVVTLVISLAVIKDQRTAAITGGSVALVLLVCAYLFASLTVEVNPQRVQLHFGPGWIRKRFAVAEISAARVVRNRWYYGWGIKLTPHGWLFNVSGLDAVEIQLHSGRKYRIGSDQPAELQAAITSVLREPPSIPPRA